MSDALRDRVARDLEMVDLAFRQVVCERGERAEWVYFPTTCLVSRVVEFESGNAIEAEIIGPRGHSATELLLGRELGQMKLLIQVAGQSHRMSVDNFRRHMENPAFVKPLASYSYDAFATLGQLAGCVAFHPLEERLARWLLMCRDELDRTDLSLTHEFLAVMLGVTRPTVTLAVGTLVKAGLIEQRRGVLRILDESELEKAACECYAVIKSFPMSE